jgi:hypothetical protein
MAHSHQARLDVRAEYLKGLPIEMAAEKAGVSPSTARRWKDRAAQAGDDWDKFQRAAMLVVGGGMDQAMARVGAGILMRSETLLEHLNSVPITDLETQAKFLGLLTDCLNKAQSAMKQLMPESNRIAIETGAVKGYVELLVRLSPGAAEAALGAMEAYSRGER